MVILENRERVKIMANYYCVYCGAKAGSVANLTAMSCPRNPDKGKHVLYEGAEKPQYTCKYCGFKAATIANLTSSTCPRNPNKGKHSPAL